MTWRVANAREGAFVEPEDAGDLGEIGELALVHGAVGAGDVEEPVEHALQHHRIVGEEARDVARIGVETGHVLLGEVVDARDVPILARRDRKDAAEGVDLRARHDAVGLRHLGGERDDADREGSLAADFARREVGEQRRECRRRRRRPCRRRPPSAQRCARRCPCSPVSGISNSPHP